AVLVAHLQVLDPEVARLDLGLDLGGRVFLGLLRSEELLADIADEIKQSHFDLLEFSIAVQAAPYAEPANRTAGRRARTLGTAVAGTVGHAFARPQDDDQHDRADRRHHQAADQPAGCEAEHPEERAADERADDTDDDVAEHAEAAPLHELPGEPAGDEPDDQEPNEFHLRSPCGASRSWLTLALDHDHFHAAILGTAVLRVVGGDRIAG